MTADETAPLTPERMRAATTEVVRLAVRHARPGERTLVYILSQSPRIGHFGLETQIIRSLYEDSYDRILILTDLMTTPGTNPWIQACAGRKIRFVETDKFDILMLGQIDSGLQRAGPLDTLFMKPRSIIIQFWRHILAGGAVKPLDLPVTVEEIARSILTERGIDPDAPFVFFHNRTLGYRPHMNYHAYRKADVTSYQPTIARLIEAGYRVIRIGEPGLDSMGFDPMQYVNVPDWDETDPAIDLFVLARCAFGVAQNSGPIWVAAAFGRPVLRTNAPFEHLNLPYLDDLTLFKHYRRAGETRWLSYREILDAGLPALFRSEDYAAAGIEMLPNDPDTLVSAVDEILARMAGRWEPDQARDDRFRALGASYLARIAADPAMVRQTLDFYGYAHTHGHLSRAQIEAHPTFLD
jgi:putative glycosyltransferase (TIGR04372 family)